LTIFTPERRYSSKHAESRKGVRISKIEGIPQFTLPNPNYVQKLTKAKKTLLPSLQRTGCTESKYGIRYPIGSLNMSDFTHAQWKFNQNGLIYIAMAKIFLPLL